MGVSEETQSALREWGERRAALIEAEIAQFLVEPNLPPYCALHVRDTCELNVRTGEALHRTLRSTTKRLRGYTETQVRQVQSSLANIAGPAELILLRGNWSDEPWPDPEPPQRAKLRSDPLFAAVGLTPTFTGGEAFYVPYPLQITRWNGD